MNRFRQAGWIFLLVILCSPVLILVGSEMPVSGGSFFRSFHVFDAIAAKRFLSSVSLSLWTVLFAVVFAIPFYMTYLTLPQKKKQGLILLSLLPLSFPPFGTASGWLTLLSNIEQTDTGRLLFVKHGLVSQWMYGFAGCGFLLALCYWPVVFLICALSHQPMRSHIEAGRLYMSRWNCFYRVFFPALKLPLGISVAVLAGLTFLQFEVPSLLQINCYSLDIFTRFSIPENEWRAILLCIPYLFIAILFAWGVRSVPQLMQDSSQKSPFMMNTQKSKGFWMGCSLFVFAISTFIPLLALFMEAGSVLFTIEIVVEHLGIVFRSVLYAAGGAIGIVGLGIFITAASNKKQSLLVPVLLMILFTIPGIFIASGWLRIRSFWPGLIPYPVMIVSLLLAYMSHRMLLGYGVGIVLWRDFGKHQKECVNLLSLSLFDRVRRLYFPSMKRSVGFAILLISLFLWGDVAQTILLHPAGGETLSVEYFNLLHYGSDSRTAAIGFLLLLTPATTYLFALLVFGIKKQIHGT